MKKLWLLPAFVSGILIGWLVGRDGDLSQTKAEISQAPATKSSRPRQTTVGNSPQDVKWIAFGKRAKDLDPEEKSTVLKELAPQDRMSALGALASQAGLDGLSDPLKSMMREILSKWGQEDFDDAWTAARSASDPDLSKFMMEFLVDSILVSDPDRAFGLHVEQAAANPDFRSSAPFGHLRAKLKVGAREYMEVLAQLPFGKNSSGYQSEFAKDFDFQFVAEELERLRTQRKDETPSSFPSNFYTEWAKKDPDAAFSWWATRKSPPFSNIENIITAVEIQNPGTSGLWLAEKLQDTSVPRTKIIEELSSSHSDAMPEKVKSVAANLPDAATADAFLTDIITVRKYSNAVERYSFAISALSSPEVRLAVFQKIKENNSVQQIDRISDAQLQQWQLSRTQLEEIFAK